MKGNKQLYTLRYRGLDPVTVWSAWDWCLDKRYPKNFVHHVMSLRWLKDVQDVNVRDQLIESWGHYHEGEGKKSKFYLGRDADHSASLRLRVLLGVKRDIGKEVGDKSNILRIVNQEIDKILKSCIEGKTYKKAHNHGLMVDVALIFSLDKGISETHQELILTVVPDRIVSQLKAIFSEDGACKEHSISYQEYNLNVLHGMRRNLQKIKSLYPSLCDLADYVDNLYKQVKIESKKLLGYALISASNKYMQLGDTFSQPKHKVIEKIFDSKSLFKALQPYSYENGYYFSSTAGFFFFRCKSFQLGFTSCWHSRVHKQNNDLSVVLYDSNGRPVLLDGGFSDLPISFDRRSAEYHSTFFPVDARWKGRDKRNINDFSGLSLEASSNSLVVKGGHNRVEGTVLNRTIEILGKSITIIDSSDVELPLIHRFILCPDKIEEFTEEGFSCLGFKFCFSSHDFRLSDGVSFVEGSEKRSIFFDVVSHGKLVTSVVHPRGFL